MNNNPELDFKDMVFLFEELAGKEAVNQKLTAKTALTYDELKFIYGIPYAKRILTIICGYYWTTKFLQIYQDKGGILDLADHYKYNVK